ncbi:MAG: type I-E CRISPR-associated protein Cas7/Cse4/CasC, partial [Anaerolineae bacterium]|nr:type I-E CRISPR-associated protein Cas7/Cse4/CasC [Anaerolineae bacterium]
MIVELHAIQSFGPSNLNRDDTGNPKDAIFGGVRRARISSQAAKRAIRVSDVFKRTVNAPTGMRTKLL